MPGCQTFRNQAACEGARIEGVTGGLSSRVPQKVPQTLQDKGRQSTTKEKADDETPVNNWECLVSALADLPFSYPARTRTLNGWTKTSCVANYTTG